MPEAATITSIMRRLRSSLDQAIRVAREEKSNRTSSFEERQSELRVEDIKSDESAILSPLRAGPQVPADSQSAAEEVPQQPTPMPAAATCPICLTAAALVPYRKSTMCMDCVQLLRGF